MKCFMTKYHTEHTLYTCSYNTSVASHTGLWSNQRRYATHCLKHTHQTHTFTGTQRVTLIYSGEYVTVTDQI